MHRIVLTALAITGCALTAQAAAPSMLTENTNGGYMGKAPHYVAHKGVLYAHDGTEWWYLRRPSIPAGHVRGMPVGQPEQWCRVGGSRVRQHQRTALSFRNQAVKPEMVEY
jgi:hypothetical protein